MAVTVHWITPDWQMRNAVLETRMVSGSHNAECVRDTVVGILSRFSLESRLSGRPFVCFCSTTNYFTVLVTDSASVNGAAVRIGGFVGWFCFAHIIHLAVMDSAKVPEVAELAVVVRDIVVFIKRSNLVSQDFAHAQLANGIYSKLTMGTNSL